MQTGPWRTVRADSARCNTSLSNADFLAHALARARERPHRRSLWWWRQLGRTAVVGNASRRRGGKVEVARMAGVSVSTVANVLSRPSIVAPETRRRVEEAILSVGYVPSGPAQQLRGVPSPIVGSMILDI